MPPLKGQVNLNQSNYTGLPISRLAIQSILKVSFEHPHHFPSLTPNMFMIRERLVIETEGEKKRERAERERE